MKVKANTSFSGTVCMAKGEIKDISDEAVLNDLLKCGYVAPFESEAKKNENKPDNKKHD